MAFSGVHVVCAYSGRQSDAGRATQAILSFPQWSETLSAPATPTGQAAPSDGCVFSVRTTVDCYIAVGKTPDASKTVSTDTNSARMPIAAGETLDLYVKAGDKIAYVAA